MAKNRQRTLDELREDAREALRVSIYDGDPGQMEEWLKYVGDEQLNGGTIRAWYADAASTDRYQGAEDGGEGCARAVLLRDAVAHLSDAALVRLIDTEYHGGLGDDALKLFRVALSGPASLADLRAKARTFLRDAIYDSVIDGSQAEMRVWLGLIGDYRLPDGQTIRKAYDDATSLDETEQGWADECREKAAVLAEAVNILSDDALATLIDYEYPEGTDKALDVFRAALRRQFPPPLRVVGADEEE